MTGRRPRPDLDPSRIPQRVVASERLAERAASLDGGSLTPALGEAVGGAENFFPFFHRWESKQREGVADAGEWHVSAGTTGASRKMGGQREAAGQIGHLGVPDGGSGKRLGVTGWPRPV